MGGRTGNRIDRCRAPQEKLHGIRVVVTGCLAQRRTPVGLSLVDRGAVFQMPTQLQHGAHCGLDQQMRRLGFLPPKKVWKNQIEGRREPGEWVGELTSCLTAVYDEAR